MICFNGIWSGNTGSFILSLGFEEKLQLCSGGINGWGGSKVFSLLMFSLFFITFTWELCSANFETGAREFVLSERTVEGV